MTKESVSTYTTAGLPESEQFAFWREAVCASITRLTAERAAPSGSFRGQLSIRALGGLKVLAGQADAHSRKRTANDIARAPDDSFFLYQPIAGTLSVERQDGQCLDARPGSLLLLMSAQPARLSLGSRHAHVTVAVPRPLVAPWLARPQASFSHRLFEADGIATLLAAYMRALVRPGAVEERFTAAVATHFSQLLALALGPSADGREAGCSALMTARAEQARRWLDQHYAEPDLTPERAAAGLGISVRYLHRLFELGGETFNQSLVQRRLRASHAALQDPANGHRTIAEIALGAGFNDISHFNRCFKATFAATPRDVRYKYRGKACRGFTPTLALRCDGEGASFFAP